jgi:hypothetical protein
MNVVTIVGLIGASCILVGFAQTSRGVWPGKSWQFQSINLVGAGLLTWYSIEINAIATIVLNGAWTAIAAYGLYRALERKNT